LKGSMVALVTPMHSDGSLDTKSLHELIDWHLEAKTEGIVISGTTGEAPTLSIAEKNEILTLTIARVNKRIPVIAGTGTNSTQSTIKNTLNAQNAGADACLVVTPYYNKPTQQGLYLHFKAVAENSSVPLILYNVPGRTGCDLLPETVERLASIKNIVGIKEATGNLARAKDLAERCGKDFLLFSGDDATSCDFMLGGGHGTISVTANIVPLKMHLLCDAALKGNTAVAKRIDAELAPLHNKLFLEPNPIPVKWLLHEMGLIANGIRLPLTPLDNKYHSDLRQALDHAGLIQTLKA
jgi:4-hydroxy-tetrahydrodipicolinate synthase